MVSIEGHNLNKPNFMRKIKKNRQICLMLFNSNGILLFSNLLIIRFILTSLLFFFTLKFTSFL
jgi:hypothetical protein